MKLKEKNITAQKIGYKDFKDFNDELQRDTKYKQLIQADEFIEHIHERITGFALSIDLKTFNLYNDYMMKYNINLKTP